MATNYERITESPERLVKFIDHITKRCTMGDSACIGCQLHDCCYSNELLLEWLQDECDE